MDSIELTYLDEKGQGYTGIEDQELDKECLRIEVNETHVQQDEMSALHTSNSISHKTLERARMYNNILVHGKNVSSFLRLQLTRQIVVFLHGLSVSEQKQPDVFAKYDLKWVYAARSAICPSVHFKTRVTVVDYMCQALNLLDQENERKRNLALINEVKKCFILCRHYHQHVRHLWWKERQHQEESILELDDDYFELCFHFLQARLLECLVCQNQPKYLILSPQRMEPTQQPHFYNDLVQSLQHYHKARQCMSKIPATRPMIVTCTYKNSLVYKIRSLKSCVEQFWSYEKPVHRLHLHSSDEGALASSVSSMKKTMHLLPHIQQLFQRLYHRSLLLQAAFYHDLGLYYQSQFQKQIESEYIAYSILCIRRACIFLMSCRETTHLFTENVLLAWIRQMFQLCNSQRKKNQECYRVNIESLLDFNVQKILMPVTSLSSPPPRLVLDDVHQQTALVLNGFVLVKN